MSENSMEAFAEACGSTEPLNFNLASFEDSAVERSVSPPFALVGRRPDSDLFLEHPDVSRRHAYLQVVDGRLFCVDLASRLGIRVRGNRSNGWLDPGSTLGIGPYDLQLIPHERGAGEVSPFSGDEPTPLSSRYDSGRELPDIALEMHVPGVRPVSSPMHLTMALVGRSEFCKIEPPIRNASRFYCSLVRTPAGLWLVDLLAPERVTVNGAAHRFVLLSDHDRVQFGNCTLVVRYGSPSELGDRYALNGSVATEGLDLPSIHQPPGWLEPDAPPTSVPSAEALAVLQQMGQMQQQMSEQFHETMGMLAQLFGTIHRDHVASIRDELQQIRLLADEIRKLQSPPGLSQSPPPAPLPPESIPSPNPSLPPTLPREPLSDEHLPKGDPHQLIAVATAHLEAYQREQNSRWRKIIRMLTP